MSVPIRWNKIKCNFNIFEYGIQGFNKKRKG